MVSKKAMIKDFGVFVIVAVLVLVPVAWSASFSDSQGDYDVIGVVGREGDLTTSGDYVVRTTIDQPMGEFTDAAGYVVTIPAFDSGAPLCGAGETLCDDMTCNVDCGAGNFQGCLGAADGVCSSGEGCTCDDCDTDTLPCSSSNVCSIDTGRCGCPAGEVPCGDGSCAADEASCPPSDPADCTDDSYCYDGSICNDRDDTCTCPAGSVICSDGSCEDNAASCPEGDTDDCVPDQCYDSSVCGPAGQCGCPAGYERCGEGCVSVFGFCDETPDGCEDSDDCVDGAICYVSTGICGCPAGTTRCSDGSCVSVGGNCPPGEDPECNLDTDCYDGAVCDPVTDTCGCSAGDTPCVGGGCSNSIDPCTPLSCDDDNLCADDAVCDTDDVDCVCPLGLSPCDDGTCAPPEQCSGSCGDGVVTAPEVCDGSTTDTCVQYGYGAGVLACTDCQLDFSGCGTPPGVYCGDGIANGAEECDALDLNGITCSSGTVSCLSDCTIDYSNCDDISPSCGNNNVDNVLEECDGTDLALQTCVSQGYDQGDLGCDGSCSFDVSDCVNLPTDCDPDSCFDGAVCDLEANFCVCPLGEVLCDTGGSPECKPKSECPVVQGCVDENGVCEPGEGCACLDCHGVQDSCYSGYTCDSVVSDCKQFMPTEITITAPTAGSVVSGVVDIEFTDPLRNRPDISIDGGAWIRLGDTMPADLYDFSNVGGNDYSLKWDTTSLADGSHNIKIRDPRTLSGQYAESNVVVVIVDNTAPSIVITQPQEGLTSFWENQIVLGNIIDDSEIVSARVEVVVGTDTTIYPLVVSPEGEFVTYVDYSRNLENKVYVYATDAAGNEGYDSRIVIHDDTIPMISIDPLPEYTNQPVITVTGTIANSYRAFLIKNGVELTDGPFSIDVDLNIGPNDIQIWAEDKVGNKVYSDTIVVVYDPDAPVVIITQPAGTLTAFVTQTLAGAVIDTLSPIAAINYSINGGAEIPIAVDNVFNVLVDLVGGAANNIIVNARDMAGNVGSAEIDVTHDENAPTAYISVPDDEFMTSDPTIAITYTMTNAAKGYILVNGANQSILTSDANPQQKTIRLREGINKVVIEAYSSAGGVVYSNTVHIILDTKVPVITLTHPTSRVTAFTDQILAGTVVDSTDAVVSYELREGAVVYDSGAIVLDEYRFFENIVLRENAVTTILVTAVDEAGNTATAQWVIEHDISAPALEITLPTEDGITNQQFITVEGDVQNSLKAWLIVNGANQTALSNGVFSVPVELSEGVNTIVIYGENGAENIAYSNTLRMTLKTVAPTGILTATPDLVRDGQSVVFEYDARDISLDVTIDVSALGGAVDLQMVDDGTGEDKVSQDGVYTVEYVLSGATDGIYLISADAVDAAGNTFSPLTEVVVDNSAPAINILINDGAETTDSLFVTLNLEYENGVECKYANENITNLTDYEWEPCLTTKLWKLIDPGEAISNRTVHYRVRDSIGNTATAKDWIILDRSRVVTDYTPPTDLTVTDDGEWTNSNSTLHAVWNAFERESNLFFRYRVLEESSKIYPEDAEWTDADDFGQAKETRITNESFEDGEFELDDGETYYFEVQAYNSFDFNSTWASSDGITADLTGPDAPSISDVEPSSGSENDWVQTSNITIEWNEADDDIGQVDSGITAYSYVLSFNETEPDTVPEGSGDLSEVLSAYYDSVPDGHLYFNVRARDGAGNWGETEYEELYIDNSRPSTPQMPNPTAYTDQQQLTFSWTDSIDVDSGISNYYLVVSDSPDFDPEGYLQEFTSSSTSYTASLDEGVTYYAKVRAMNKAGLYSSWSNEVSEKVDTTPPSVVFYKPIGTVQTTQPLLVVQTDEAASCEYRVSDTYGEFEFGGGDSYSIWHETRLTISGSATPEVKCRDVIGNVLDWTSLDPIDVDGSAVVTDVDMSIKNTPYYAGQTVDHIELTTTPRISAIEQSDVEVSLNDLPLSDFNFDDTGNKGGEGIYKLMFTAPVSAGVYNLSITIQDGTGSADITIEAFEISVGYSGTSDEESNQISYGVTENYAVGVGSDSSDVTVSGTEVVSSIADGYTYLFVTNPDANVIGREKYLEDQNFDEVINPSFGYAIEKDMQTINSELEYSDIVISGDQNIPSGRYKLVIRNNGLTEDGRTNITMSII